MSSGGMNFSIYKYRGLAYSFKIGTKRAPTYEAQGTIRPP